MSHLGRFIYSATEGGSRWCLPPVCEQDISKSCGCIPTIPGKQVECVTSTNWFDFGEDQNLIIWIIFWWFFTIEGLGQNRERARYFKMLWTSSDKTQWMILFGDKNKPFRFWFRSESRSELSWDTKCKLFTLVERCASPSAVRSTFVSDDLAHRSDFQEQYKPSWGTSNHETNIMMLNTDNTARSREMPASPDWTIRVTCCKHWRGASGKVLNSHFLTGETDDVTGMS